MWLVTVTTNQWYLLLFCYGDWSWTFLNYMKSFKYKGSFLVIDWRSKDEYYLAHKMMRVRASTVRRRRAQSATTALQKEKDLNNNKNQIHGSARVKKKSVQWADDLDCDFRKGPLRKFHSDGYLEFDKALRKLTKVSSILERSATLEKDFEEDLQNIQKRLETELDLKTTEEPTEGYIWEREI